MNANNRNLLAIALATVLLSPAAWAQNGKGPPDMPRVEPAPPAPVPNSPEQTMRDIHKPATTTTDQAETTLPPPSPPESQGGEHAAAHSSVVQRDLWTRLDTNGDGKISTSEGEADAAFNTDFSTMDTDDDGFVSDAEYRTAAKEDVRAGGADSSSNSSGRMGDVMHRLDANADGSISLSEGEADATIKSNFSSIDSNSDGMVSRAEYQAWLKTSRK
jgi:Ca2+-binding EF-hand superfamily protein